MCRAPRQHDVIVCVVVPEISHSRTIRLRRRIRNYRDVHAKGSPPRRARATALRACYYPLVDGFGCRWKNLTSSCHGARMSWPAAGKPPAKAHLRMRRRNRGAVRSRPRGTWSKRGRVKALRAMEMIFFFVLSEKMSQNGARQNSYQHFSKAPL